MSTESKYSLVLSFPPQRGWLLVACMVMLMGSVVTTLNVVLWGAGGLAAILLCLLFRSRQRRNRAVQFVTVTENGEWYECVDDFEPSQQIRWQVTNQSKLTPFALFIALCNPVTKVTRYQWIWPEQTDDLGYRRLARIVYRSGLN